MKTGKEHVLLLWPVIPLLIFVMIVFFRGCFR